MAKKTRPSFSAAKPAAPSRDTAWVYRTDGDAPAARAKRSAAAKPTARAKPAARVKSPRPVEPVERAPTAHYDDARAILSRYVAGGAAASAIPLPFVDLAAVGAVHVMMVRAIAAEYGLPFDRVAIKAAIAAVAGGAVSHWMGRAVGRSALKALPGIGAFAAAAVPVSTGATTYALGRIVIAHFESGGSLADLDAEAAARHTR
ncbi:MAG: DUF697 domain-containing protein, partial [Acidobacteria bacterium]|nr:DUF697 domain-containing protein [Acidobacteriota bacterium]